MKWLINFLIGVYNFFARKEFLKVCIKKKMDNRDIHSLLKTIEKTAPKKITFYIGIGVVANKFIGKEILIDIDGLSEKGDVEFMNRLRKLYAEPAEYAGNLKFYFRKQNNKSTFIRYSQDMNFDKMRK